MPKLCNNKNYFSPTLERKSVHPQFLEQFFLCNMSCSVSGGILKFFVPPLPSNSRYYSFLVEPILNGFIQIGSAIAYFQLRFK